MIPPIDLIAAAAVLFDVSDGAIVSKTRGNTRLNQARQAVAWVMRQHDYTLMEIAAILHRDHTTIVYSVRHVKALVDTDPAFAAKLRAAGGVGDGGSGSGVREGGNPESLIPNPQSRYSTYMIKAPLRLTLAFWGVAMPLTA